MALRKTWIDALKGVLILLVILGHSTSNSIIRNLLSSFYMPCFFILSGWVMRKDGDVKTFILKRIRSVLFSYLFFSLIWILFCFAKEFIIKSDFNILRALVSIFLPYSGSAGGNVYILWFLPCLFLSQAIVATFIYGRRYLKIISIIVWIGFILLGLLFEPYCSLLFASSMASVFVAVGFYTSNYFFPKVKKINQLSYVLFIVFAGLIHVLSFVLNVCILKNSLDFSATSFGFIPIYVLGAISGSFVLIGIISKIKTLKVLQYVGKNSLVYYALHYEVLAIATFFIPKFVSASFIVFIACYIFTIAITTCVVWIYNKLKIGILFK